MKKLFFIAGIATMITGLAIVIISSIQEESLRNVKKPWKVEKIFINTKPANKQFKRLSFALLDNNEIILPKFPGIKEPYPVKYSKWKYQRRGLFNGQIVIDDTVYDYFHGIYEIEILERHRPKLMRLHSDSIAFYLREQHFSLEKSTIKMESFYNHLR